MLTVEARRVLATRAEALDSRDFALVRECEDYLARLGVDPADFEQRTVVVETSTKRTRVRAPRASGS